MARFAMDLARRLMRGRIRFSSSRSSGRGICGLNLCRNRGGLHNLRKHGACAFRRYGGPLFRGYRYRYVPSFCTEFRIIQVQRSHDGGRMQGGNQANMHAPLRKNV